MATKKTTAKHAQKGIDVRLRQRAQAISTNTKRYDAITRKAVARALREQHADLADCITRAERGELINDLTAAEAAGRAGQDDLHLFDYHFAAALHLARYSPAISAVLYEGMADAWNNFQNDMPSLADFSAQPEFIRLALETDREQRAARKGAA
jgi:hypothetical protein